MQLLHISSRLGATQVWWCRMRSDLCCSGSQQHMVWLRIVWQYCLICQQIAKFYFV